jgi:hypothetical protein
MACLGFPVLWLNSGNRELNSLLKNYAPVHGGQNITGAILVLIFLTRFRFSRVFYKQSSEHTSNIHIALSGLSQRPNYTDRSISAKLVPIFTDRGCRVVSATDPGILDFLDHTYQQHSMK